MKPILNRIGPFFVYAYTVWLGLGMATGLGLTAALNRRRGLPGWIDGVLAAAAGALVGGRIGYVWLNRAYFAGHSGEAWQVWRGGLAYHGALAGGLLAFWLWTRLAQSPRARGGGAYADLLAPGLALFAVFAWGACWGEGCAYGREVGMVGPLLPVVGGELPDDYGIFALRYRTQAGGALLSAVVLAASLWLALRPNGRLAGAPGALFWLTLGGLSLARALIDPWRGDPFPLAGGYRLDLLLDLLVAALCLAAILVALSRGAKK